MKAKDAKMAAILCEALDDLGYEIAPPVEADREQYEDCQVKPLPFMATDQVVKVMIELDGDGTLHTIASVPVSILQRGCVWMHQLAKDELASLGVVIE